MLLSCTQTMKKSTTQFRDYSGEVGLVKIKKKLALYCYLMSNSTEKGIEKEWHTRILVLKFPYVYDGLAIEMNKCIQKTELSEWMTKEKTTWIQKDPLNETASNNYRFITCLLMMWKILTAQIREEIYYSLISYGLFPKQQKGCCKEIRGTRELLYIYINTSATRVKRNGKI